MNWYLLIFLLPLGIMAIGFYKAIQMRRNPPAPLQPDEARKKFRLLEKKIAIGIGIFSIFMAALFATDLFGPRIEGEGKILSPVNISNYEIRIKGSIPIRFEEQALFLQKRGDRESFSFITSSELTKAIGSPDELPVDVSFEETMLLKTTTTVWYNGERFDLGLTNISMVGFIAFTFLILIGLGGNWRIIWNFFVKK